jgi:glycosyltransferase involved in cell wall biosynthesis
VRILIPTGIFPPDIGGPATYVPVIAAELAARGHEVEVICLSESPSPRRGDRVDGFVVERIRRGLPRGVRFARTVGRILGRGMSADVLFVNGLYLEAVCANLILRKPLAMKIVGDWAWERMTTEFAATADFDRFEEAKTTPKARAAKRLRTFYARRADAVIVPSAYLSRATAHWGVGAERIHVIHNATELPSGLGRARISLGTPVNAVTVGRLVRWKHVDRILEIIARLPDVGLVIVGEGPERKRLEALATLLGLTSRVRFYGQQSREQALSLMSACDLMVLNSTYEGFPHVALEAMRLGVPIVASAAGGTAELVHHEENGLLVPPLDDDGLREAVSRLASSRTERERLAHGGTQTVERFGLCSMVAKTEELITRVAGREAQIGLAIRA